MGGILYDSPFIGVFVLLSDFFKRFTVLAHCILLPSIRLTCAVFGHRLRDYVELFIFQNKHILAFLPS